MFAKRMLLIFFTFSIIATGLSASFSGLNCCFGALILEGQLLEDGEKLIAGQAVKMTLRIYDDEFGGQLLFEENQEIVSGSKRSLFTFEKGEITVRKRTSNLATENLWVEVESNGQVMNPRLNLAEIGTVDDLTSGSLSLIEASLRTAGESALVIDDTGVSLGGLLGIGVENSVLPLYIRQEEVGLTYPLKLENKAYGDESGESDVGILFSAGGSGTDERGKGALIYETTSTWNRGSFHFLQDSGQNTSNPDISDSVMTINNSGQVGIGISAPESLLDVNGNSRIRGDLVVDGAITGSIDVSQITGLLGGGYTSNFPDILNNLAFFEMASIGPSGDVVILTGPGFDIERIAGFDSNGAHVDSYGLAMEHPFIFEVDGALADDLEGYFDAYFADPKTTDTYVFSIRTNDLSGTQVSQWNYTSDFKPDSYIPGNDDRTRFTLSNKNLPNPILECSSVPTDPFGSSPSFNPATDQRIEISGVQLIFAELFEDEAARTITFEFQFQEGNGVLTWVKQIVEGVLNRKEDATISWLDAGSNILSQVTYDGCFPIKYEQDNFGLDTKLTAKVTLSYDSKEIIN